MVGELGVGVGVGRGRGEGRCWELVEVEVGGGERVPTMDTGLDLAVVGGGADVVNGDVVGGDEAGDVEELDEVAVDGKRHQYYDKLGFGLVILVWRGHCYSKSLASTGL